MFFYGLLGGTGALATTLFDSPARLVANKVLSTYQVGIISAYQGGSTQMAVFLLTAGAQVFFPIASRTPDKKALFHKLNRALWPTFPLIILAFLLGLTLYLKILGDKYPTQLIPCFVFAIAAALGFVNGILIWFVITYGWRGITLNAVVGVGAGLIHLLTCFFAIPRWGLNGAGLAYIFANAIVTAGLYLPRVQEWLNKGETHALKV